MFFIAIWWQFMTLGHVKSCAEFFSYLLYIPIPNQTNHNILWFQNWKACGKLVEQSSETTGQATEWARCLNNAVTRFSALHVVIVKGPAHRSRRGVWKTGERQINSKLNGRSKTERTINELGRQKA
ncbi:MAG: hypothetical protein IJO87_08685 [Eggerthellaceae bacterium]|nr:hypothetical protein [Eggerthellaceae bacterium]